MNDQNTSTRNKPRGTIHEIVDNYLSAFPEEQSRLRSLVTLIKTQNQESQYIDRKNFVGHITASGLILSPDLGHLLFLRHRHLNRWLQPGGHVQPTDESILSAAKREIFEETEGCVCDYLPFHTETLVPIDIDSHDIPDAPAKKEPQHVHHDFRFLFHAVGSVDLKSEKKVADGDLVWISLDQVLTQETFKHAVEKIRIALSKEFLPRRFYNSLTATITVREPVDTIVVSHLLPESYSYLKAISSVYNVRAVIPKPKSIDTAIRKEIEKDFHLAQLSRPEIAEVTPLLSWLDDSTRPFVLMDIGGYFAPITNTLFSKYPTRFLGVIEDTENGLQKYELENRREPLTAPVISVARSPLKDNEDFLIGQSVLFSADAILRECGLLFQYLRCGVLGFGKIGRSIAHHLQLRGIKPEVYDVEPVKRIEAYNRLCEIPELPELLSGADVVFSATGQHSLGIEAFRKLKPGCFVISVTSSEDEFDTSYLTGEYNCEMTSADSNVFRYSKPSHYFYFVNQGNAVNFLHNAIVGPFIHLVRGEMIFASAKLTRREASIGISQISKEDRDKVSNIWLGIFNTGRQLSTRFEIRDKMPRARP